MCHIYVRCRSLNVYRDNKDINVVFITFSGFYLDCVKNDLHFSGIFFFKKMQEHCTYNYTSKF